jgi:hypothetical protein
VTPLNFSTFATPHVGIPRYRGFRSSLMGAIGPKLLSRTGEQLYCKDEWDSEGRPLLEVMSQKGKPVVNEAPYAMKAHISCNLTGSVFISALSLFKTVRIYANA